MLDIDFMLENPDVVKAALEAKGVDLNLDRLFALHADVKAALGEVEDLRHQRNILSKKTGEASEDERPALIERSRAVGDRIKDLEPSLREKQDELRLLMLQVPNIPGRDEPVGPDEESNVELRRSKGPPSFAFDVRDHVDILEQQDWADVSRVGKVAGSRSYALKGELLQLEMALWRFALDFTQQRDFTLISMPSMARSAAFVGTGHFPHGEEDVYRLGEDDLYLSGTAEVGLNALHGEEIVPETDLPLRYAGFSTCFRREAGAAGRDVRGLLRVHQFYKVEQYVACVADKDESARWFDQLLANGEAIVQALEIPYRIIRLSTGDMGAGKVRTWDIECWIPSQEQYRETHSVSEYYDWQARRTDLRYRDGEGTVRHMYTLNNTALATPRILAPLLENHQQADGTVRVPEALRPYVGGKEMLGTPR